MLRNRALERIRGAATAVERRLRLARALAVLPRSLAAAVAAGVLTLAAQRAFPGRIPARVTTIVVAAAPLFALAAMIIAALRRLPDAAGAVALDRHGKLEGRIAAALSFAARPRAERNALMDLAIDDACAHAEALDPRGAAPIPTPRGLLASGLALVAMVAALRIEAPVSRATPDTPAARAEVYDLALAPDDVAVLREAAAQLQAGATRSPAASAIGRFARLVEEIATRRIGREEALRAAFAIERDLGDGEEARASGDRSRAGGAEETRPPSADPRAARAAEQRALREHLRDLREMIGAAGRADRDHRTRARYFGDRARGNSRRGGNADDGERSDGVCNGDREDDEPEAPPAPTADVRPTPPDGPRDPHPLPRRPVRRGGSGAGAGAIAGNPRDPARPRETAAQSGEDAGKGHDARLAGPRDDLAARTFDAEDPGLAAQGGRSRREIIVAAAERGFRGAGYRDTFTQYRTVAEDRMTHDTLPDGFRAHARRYFQLIRPRD